MKVGELRIAKGGNSGVLSALSGGSATLDVDVLAASDRVFLYFYQIWA